MNVTPKESIGPFPNASVGSMRRRASTLAQADRAGAPATTPATAPVNGESRSHARGGSHTRRVDYVGQVPLPTLTDTSRIFTGRTVRPIRSRRSTYR